MSFGPGKLNSWKPYPSVLRNLKSVASSGGGSTVEVLVRNKTFKQALVHIISVSKFPLGHIYPTKQAEASCKDM